MWWLPFPASGKEQMEKHADSATWQGFFRRVRQLMHLDSAPICHSAASFPALKAGSQVQKPHRFPSGGRIGHQIRHARRE